MTLQIGALNVEDNPDAKLPGAIRSTSNDHLQFMDPVRTQRVFRFVVRKDDVTKAVSAVRRAADEVGLGVRVIKSDPDGNGRVQISAQGKPRRAYKPRAPLTEQQKQERAAKREARKAAAAKSPAKSGAK
jgi:hypothetical protein